MRYPGNQRGKTPPLLRLGSGEGESAHGAPVEGSEEGDHLLAAGMVPGQLQGALDGFRSGVSIVKAMGSGHGRNGRQAFGKGHHVFVIKVGSGDVDQLRGLLLDGGDDLGMAMPGRNNGDAGGKVQEFVSIDIFNAQAQAALGHHGIGAGVAGRDVAFVAGDNRAGFRSRHRTEEFRPVLGKNGAALLTIVLHDAFSAFSAFFQGESIVRRRWDTGRTEAGQSFGGGKLVAAEETRSGAGGEHAQCLLLRDMGEQPVFVLAPS